MVKEVRRLKNYKGIMFSADNLHLAEEQGNDYYMTLTMRLFNTEKNRNGDKVSEAFIDDIIANENDYIGLPLCADTRKMKSGQTRGLGHMYDPNTGTWLTHQIGSFVKFEKAVENSVVSLIGTARIYKRDADICATIQKLYDSNALRCSFEIQAGDISIDTDGACLVDASEKNHLIGMAVVSVPAYPSSTALDLVAEAKEEENTESISEISIAEMTFDTVWGKIFAWLLEHVDNIMDFTFERLCPDCAILYERWTGKTYKLDYVVEGDSFVVTDMYEVRYTRADETTENESRGENDMENMKNEPISMEQMEAAKKEAETVIAQKDAVITEKDALIAEKDSTIAQKDERIAELDNRIAELEASIAELMPFKEQVETMQAEQAKAEAEAKKEQMKAFAEKNHLDLETEVVANAIEAGDYETLVAETMKASEEDAAKLTTVSRFVGAEMRMEKSDWLFDRAQE